ncbi:hypothetical protein [Amphritea balenae]|uniref:Uncharacterized protein n=1 Tax=Amphritea balenae TaxID=452629 RepID=A0A3P1SQ63_9GAMM|nr:hypothetical protein [Amphritea balenae]RRC98282.1 hypothetical protein EHS89_14415 [Amphritea balenae]
MIRKNFSYDIQKHSKNHGIALKRSHAYELIAAYFGYSSQAAMDASGFMMFNMYAINYEDFSVTNVTERSAQLGYSTSEADTFAQVLSRLVDEQNLSFSEYLSSMDERWELDNLEETSLQELEYLSATQPGAQYSLACLNEIEPSSERDSYWFKKQQQGIELTPSQKQFADDYEAALNQFSFYRSLLVKAANNGHGNAAFDLAEQGGNDADKYYQQAAELGCVEAQEFLGLSKNDIKWKVDAAKGGSRECLEELARSAADKNDEISAFEAHKWTALAKHYGFDLTQSLADNDEDYGPAFIIYVGLNLPSIAQEMKVEAHAEAFKIFQQYSD